MLFSISVLAISSSALSPGSYGFQVPIGSVLNRGISLGNPSAAKSLAASSTYAFPHGFSTVASPVDSPYSAAGYIPTSTSVVASSNGGGMSFTTFTSGGYDNIFQITNSQLPGLQNNYGPYGETEYLWLTGFPVYDQQTNPVVQNFAVLDAGGAYEIIFNNPIPVQNVTNVTQIPLTILGTQTSLMITGYTLPSGTAASTTTAAHGGRISFASAGSSSSSTITDGQILSSSGVGPGWIINLLWVNTTTVGGKLNRLQGIIAYNSSPISALTPGTTTHTTPGITFVGDTLGNNYDSLIIQSQYTSSISYKNLGLNTAGAGIPYVSNVTEPSQELLLNSQVPNAFSYGGSAGGSAVYLLTPYELNEYGHSTSSSSPVNISISSPYSPWYSSLISPSNPLVVTITGYPSNTATSRVSTTLTFTGLNTVSGLSAASQTTSASFYNITSIVVNRALPIYTISATDSAGHSLATLLLAGPYLLLGAQPGTSYYGVSTATALTYNQQNGQPTSVFDFTQPKATQVPVPILAAYQISENNVAGSTASTDKFIFNLLLSPIAGALPAYHLNYSQYLVPNNLTYVSSQGNSVNAPVGFISERGSKISAISPTSITLSMAMFNDSLQFVVAPITTVTSSTTISTTSLSTTRTTTLSTTTQSTSTITSTTTIPAPLAISPNPPSVSSTAIKVGQSSVISTTATGGTAPYRGSYSFIMPNSTLCVGNNTCGAFAGGDISLSGGSLYMVVKPLNSFQLELITTDPYASPNALIISNFTAQNSTAYDVNMLTPGKKIYGTWKFRAFASDSSNNAAFGTNVTVTVNPSSTASTAPKISLSTGTISLYPGQDGSVFAYTYPGGIGGTSSPGLGINPYAGVYAINYSSPYSTSNPFTTWRIFINTTSSASPGTYYMYLYTWNSTNQLSQYATLQIVILPTTSTATTSTTSTIAGGPYLLPNPPSVNNPTIRAGQTAIIGTTVQGGTAPYSGYYSYLIPGYHSFCSGSYCPVSFPSAYQLSNGVLNLVVKPINAYEMELISPTSYATPNTLVIANSTFVNAHSSDASVYWFDGLYLGQNIYGTWQFTAQAQDSKYVSSGTSGAASVTINPGGNTTSTTVTSTTTTVCLYNYNTSTNCVINGEEFWNCVPTTSQCTNVAPSCGTSFCSCSVGVPVNCKIQGTTTTTTSSTSRSTTIPPFNTTSTVKTTVSTTIPTTTIFPYATYTLTLKQGWNLFSVPLAYVVNVNSACTQSNVLSPPLQLVDGRYVAAKFLYGGIGYWIDLNSQCSVTFIGPAFSQGAYPALSAGWNQIGALNYTIPFSSVGSDCQVTSGPWAFSTSTNKYTLSTQLAPGNGYLVKVASACGGSSSSGPAPPPPPPGRSPTATGGTHAV